VISQKRPVISDLCQGSWTAISKSAMEGPLPTSPGMQEALVKIAPMTPARHTLDVLPAQPRGPVRCPALCTTPIVQFLVTPTISQRSGERHCGVQGAGPIAVQEGTPERPTAGAWREKEALVVRARKRAI